MAGVGVNNYPGGFAGNLTVRNVPLAVANPGKVWWVSNATTLMERQIGGSDGNPGTYDKPFATIQKAITSATANRGDIIFVKPGHAETVSAAAGLVLSTAGVAIVGLGAGSLRPTITLDTATTATITVTASNVSIQNFLFKANFAAIVTCFAIANAQVAREFVIDSCEFRDISASLNFLSVLTVGTTANIADGLTFSNNKIFQAATSGTIQSISLASIVDRLYVGGNYAQYSQTTGTVPCFLGLGTSINHTNLTIEKNRILTPKTDSTNGAAVGGSGTMTGVCYDNYVANLDATSSIWIPTGLGLLFVQNYAHITGQVDKNALVNPAAA